MKPKFGYQTDNQKNNKQLEPNMPVFGRALQISHVLFRNSEADLSNKCIFQSLEVFRGFWSCDIFQFIITHITTITKFKRNPHFIYNDSTL